jgi:hypothetical protein
MSIRRRAAGAVRRKPSPEACLNIGAAQQQGQKMVQDVVSFATLEVQAAIRNAQAAFVQAGTALAGESKAFQEALANTRAATSKEAMDKFRKVTAPVEGGGA